MDGAAGDIDQSDYVAGWREAILKAGICLFYLGKTAEKRQ
jgi:hypothetical protein